MTGHSATLRRGLHGCAVVALAIAAGALLNRLGVPLPWILGPLVVSAASGLAGAPLPDSRLVRDAAQVVIGAAIGYGFPAGFLIGLLTLLPWMVALAVWSIVVAAVFSLLLAKLASLDRQSALLANLPGGVAVMAFVGDVSRSGSSAISVIQALRVSSLVLLMPLLLALVLEDNGRTSAVVLAHGSFGTGTVAVLGLGYIGGRLLGRLGMRNAFIIAALVVALTDNLGGLLGASIPEPLFVAAQIAIGITLGTRFRREEVARLPRIMAAGLAVSLLTSAVIIVSALLLAWLLGEDLAVIALAGTPGGVAEMVLTAAALGIPVPEVVAFQMVRIVIVNASAGFVASLWLRLHGRDPRDCK